MKKAFTALLIFLLPINILGGMLEWLEDAIVHSNQRFDTQLKTSTNTIARMRYQLRKCSKNNDFLKKEVISARLLLAKERRELLKKERTDEIESLRQAKNNL